MKLIATFTVIFKNIKSTMQVMGNYFECNTCGRPFKEGQGIILTVAGIKLFFHSKACAFKFFKEIMENADSEYLGKDVKEVYDKYQKIIELKKKKAEKKI
ncbi:hypothetical protein RQ359_000733 [Sulfuracidifex metallicus DSM 6482 = JCM 9184]|nr:hypothetical protein RQ359_000733 [Sulfuracidifex metallicus DSM 6482 = JCM 9184]